MNAPALALFSQPAGAACRGVATVIPNSFLGAKSESWVLGEDQCSRPSRGMLLSGLQRYCLSPDTPYTPYTPVLVRLLRCYPPFLVLLLWFPIFSCPVTIISHLFLSGYYDFPPFLSGYYHFPSFFLSGYLNVSPFSVRVLWFPTICLAVTMISHHFLSGYYQSPQFLVRLLRCYPSFLVQLLWFPIICWQVIMISNHFLSGYYDFPPYVDRLS